MIALGESQALEGVSSHATEVTYTISGCLVTIGTPPAASAYEVLAQGQLAASAGSIYNPGASNYALISSIHLFNNNTVAEQVSLFIEGTAAANKIVTLNIPAGGFSTYEDGVGWNIYNASGLLVTGSSLIIGAVGTPSSATTALTASTRIVVGGSLFSVLPNSLAVGQIFQWNIGIIKTTAAGAATWTAIVSIGSTGTNTDPSVATFTSGTNTAAIDQAILVITARITALGSGTSATAQCNATYASRLTEATGLGSFPLIPGATAGFDSTVSTPQLHVDITMGASAVCTSVCSAERLA